VIISCVTAVYATTEEWLLVVSLLFMATYGGVATLVVSLLFMATFGGVAISCVTAHIAVYGGRHNYF
jgi:hypothetical protein